HQDAGLEFPDSGGLCPDRGRVGFPHSEGLHLLCHGVLSGRRVAQPAYAQEARGGSRAGPAEEPDERRLDEEIRSKLSQGWNHWAQALEEGLGGKPPRGAVARTAS